MINLDYKDGRSIHEQIEAGFKELIINGFLKYASTSAVTVPKSEE